MRIQRRWINNYVKGLENVSNANIEKLYKALETLDTNAPNLVGQVTAIMQMICQYSAKQGAAIAAGMYDVIHEAELGYKYGAEAIDSYVPEATAVATRAILAEGVNEKARTELAKRISFEVKRSAGECVRLNTWHENRQVKAYGKRRVKARYARVPGYSEAYGDGCPFCKMLASRGFIYTTEEAAGNEFDHYHAKCQCTVLPSFAETDIAGYDPDRYYDEWMNYEASMAKKQAEKSKRDVEEVVQERLDRLEAIAANAPSKNKH